MYNENSGNRPKAVMQRLEAGEEVKAALDQAATILRDAHTRVEVQDAYALVEQARGCMRLVNGQLHRVTACCPR